MPQTKRATTRFFQDFCRQPMLWQRRLICGLLVLLGLQSASLEACPGFLRSGDFRPALPTLARANWRLFSLTSASSASKAEAWQELPMQIDPMSKSGHLIFWDAKAKPEDQPDPELFKSDRIVVDTEGFGRRLAAKRPLVPPCKTSNLYEIFTRGDRQRAAYLAWCKDPQDEGATLQAPPPVTISRDQHKVVAPHYTYDYLPENHLMFSQILLHPEAGSKQSVVASRMSEQIMRADVKNFFTLVFDKKDVESELIETRVGPLSLLGRLTFFLRILFFRVDLALSTDVSFFRDSVYVPMVINFPTDAPSRVHPASGILFTYEVSEAMRWLSSEKDIPLVRPDLIKEGAQSLARYGQKYCGPKNCRFVLKGEFGQYQWAMNFLISRKLLGLGFYPMFVRDYAGTQKALGWDDDAKADKNRVGFYMETSGLSKGEHPYDFWIQLGTKDKPLRDVCPVPLMTGRRYVL